LSLVPNLDTDQDRLHAANMIILRAFEQAVEVLRPGPTATAHDRLPWFEERLCDWREIAGFRRLHPADARQLLNELRGGPGSSVAREREDRAQHAAVASGPDGVRTLGLSAATSDALICAGILTAKDVSEAEASNTLQHVRGMGTKRLAELRQAVLTNDTTMEVR